MQKGAGSVFRGANSKSIFGAILIPFCLAYEMLFFFLSECMPADLLMLHSAAPLCPLPCPLNNMWPDNKTLNKRGRLPEQKNGGGSHFVSATLHER